MSRNRTLARRAITTSEGALGGGYVQRVLATAPIAYWKQNEGSGSTIVDTSGNGFDGAYTGVTWDGTAPPMGGQAPFYDGLLDFGNIYSAGFASAFNLDEGACLCWIRSSDWSDAGQDFVMHLFRDANNQIRLVKTTANTIRFNRFGDGISDLVDDAIFSGTGWFAVMISWSVNNDELIAYKNGLQTGATQTGLIAATGSGLSITGTVIGAQTTGAVTPWDGYIAAVIIWDKPADAAMIALGIV